MWPLICVTNQNFISTRSQNLWQSNLARKWLRVGNLNPPRLTIICAHCKKICWKIFLMHKISENTGFNWPAFSHIRENTDQWKYVFSHILCSEYQIAAFTITIINVYMHHFYDLPYSFSNSFNRGPCWRKSCLTLSWRRPLSCRNQPTDLLCKSMDWFLYDNGLRHERVNKYMHLCHIVRLLIIRNKSCIKAFLLMLVKTV